MLIFYDYEVFMYDWLVVFIDPINDVKTVIVNDKARLEAFHKEHQEHIYIGFNSRHYDQYIHKGILAGFNPYDISQWIITKKRKGWEYSDIFNKIKMYNYDVYKGMTDNGLKTLEAFMGNNIEETSVPFNIDRKLNAKEIAETIKYCTHDVEQLIEVFQYRKGDFNTHLAMINEFELGLNLINKTSAQLISVILGSVKKKYDDDDEWDIYLPDTLRLGKYWHIGEWLKNNRSDDPYIIKVAGVEHVFADGGVHAAIPQFYYDCKPDEIMIMADVTSLYPSLMIVYDLLSRSVSDKGRFKHIYDMNIELKKNEDPRRPIYKLICNTTYGCSGDKYNSLYDPRNRRLVCIFGQVLLLDLIEKLEPHCKLIQSNTDGILILIKRKDFDLIDDIVHEWEERTHLSMEFEYFKRIYQKDVNNYVAVPYGPLYNEKGKPRWKSKGGYVKKLSALDNDLPIINEALNEYMLKGIKLEDTINNCNELIKFQKVFKLTSKYEFVRHNNQDSFNKSYRVFASNDVTDTPIYKCKKFTEDGVELPEVKCDKFANTPGHAFILNGNINGMEIPKKLDRTWYINLAYKRLEQFTGGR